MALTRREFLCVVPLCASVLIGCTASSTPVAGQNRLTELAQSRTSNPSARTILVFMPETPQTLDVWKGLSDELAEDYHLVAVRVEHADESSTIRQAIQRYRPAAVVLMNNPTVSAYREYQAQEKETRFVPAVIVMTSFLERQSRQLTAATGISYEVPLITVMTNLRRLITLRSERVGVVVRAPLRNFVGRQVALANREQVIVEQEVVDARPNPSEIKRALRNLKQRADVLWILNDDRLLTPQLISDGWLPGLDERPWIPSIVGAGSLVSPLHSFGTFAVLPDHVALGSQAASIILDLADNGWSVDSGATIQLPLSTTTTMDLVQVKERFVLQKDALEQVDRILE